MGNYNIGSKWRKWDLHVHTPASIVQHYGGNEEEIWQKYIQDLENLPREFKVLGINDYFFINGYERLKREKEENGRLKNIDLLLPVIELRIDKLAGLEFGNTVKPNMHIIFSNEISANTIKEQFLPELKNSYVLSNGEEWNAKITEESLEELGRKIYELTPIEKRTTSNLLQLGFDNVTVDDKKIIETLEKNTFFKDKYLIGLGKSEWSDMKWTSSSTAGKRDIIQKSHIIFAASRTEEEFEKSRELLKKQNVNSNLLHCSDAHYFSDSNQKERIGNCMTWIKADTTFEGLRYAINEYEKRVCVTEDIPEKEKIIHDNKTKYMKSIEIKKDDQFKCNDIWFNNKIELSKDLVAIIGNKGNGKSALADIIAFAGGYCAEEDMSFLNEKRFRNPKEKLAECFYAELVWEDEEIRKKINLGEKFDKSKIPLVKYIPQSYLENVCNEIIAGEESKFTKELGKVIFSHIPKEERIGCNSIEELIEQTTKSKEIEKYDYIEQLKKINKTISDCTKKISPDYKNELEQKLSIKKNELSALSKQQPEKVKEPEKDEAIQASQNEILENLKQKNKLKDTLNEEKRRISLELEKINININKLKDIIFITNKIETDVKQHKTEIQEIIDYNKLELNLNNIITVEINHNIINEKLEKIISQKQQLDNQMDIKVKTSVEKRLEDVEDEIKVLINKLSEPNKKYQKYKEEEKIWQERIKKINGSETENDSIIYYEKEISKIENEYPEKIKELEQERINVLNSIYKNVKEEIKIREQYYSAVQNFIDSNKTISEEIQLKFNVSITQNGFVEKFMQYIDSTKKGTYLRDNSAIINILKETNFDTMDGIRTFVNKVIESINFNIKEVDKREIFVLNQLRNPDKYNELLDYIFSLEYLTVQYELKLGDKSLKELSPGEKGLLLLIFYLLIDKDDMPLIIDQPEENLDNETIAKILVECINIARNRRQIIMVTHNPNLAVVCDAEQVIYCEIEKNNKNKVNYVTGALENPTINKYVTDILEGTMRAFKIRDDKYMKI